MLEEPSLLPGSGAGYTAATLEREVLRIGHETERRGARLHEVVLELLLVGRRAGRMYRGRIAELESAMEEEGVEVTEEQEDEVESVADRASECHLLAERAQASVLSVRPSHQFELA